MSGRGVVKALSNMSIDEVSLVDRGANQHALISFAKRAPGADEVFEKARGGKTVQHANDHTGIDEFHGDDPANVVDEFVQNDKKGDVGPGGTIKGVERVKGQPTPPGAKKSGTKPSVKDGKEEQHTDELAKALGLYLDFEEEELEKAFGAPSPSPFQQGGPPQFGNPPAMQTAGAMPMGMGAPQAPPGAGAPGMQMPGPAMPGAMPGMGQQPMQLPQLPPEVVQYIQQLEQKLAEATKSSSPEGSDSSSSDSSNDSSSSSDNSDSSNKPFGKRNDVDTNDFLEELSKALKDEDSRETVTKAFSAQQEQFREELSKRDAQVAELTQFAKAERDLRLEREFIAKAAEFDVPVAAEELGPVLKRAAEGLSMEDFSVIVKCLDAAGAADALFGEVGKRGTADNADIFQMVEAQADELSKSADGPRGAEAVAQVFEMNPEMYDQYKANKASGNFGF